MKVHLSNGEQPPFAAGDAVLVVDSGGRRYAFDMKLVAEVRAADAVQNAISRQAPAVLHRNGVRVPVFGLDDPAHPGAGSSSGAVVVLDLTDRMAAIAVDAVCEVRITQARSCLAPEPNNDSLRNSIAWIAVWAGGEAPVLDAGAWLRAREARSAEPCVP